MNKIWKMKSTLAGGMLMAVLALTYHGVQAHAVVKPQDVAADSYQKLTFRITHGCDGSPTMAVIVRVPVSLHGAKPMPKAGWSIATQIEPLAERIVGNVAAEDVEDPHERDELGRPKLLI